MNSGTTQSGFRSMNFLLRVGQKDLPCKTVHDFKQEIEYETIREGGRNDSVHIRPKPVTKPFTFQVERYVGSGFEDPLPTGLVLTEDLLVLVGEHPGNFSEPQAEFTFRGCIVSGKSYSGLDAEKSGLIVETTTIAYEQMEVRWKDGKAAT